MSNQNTTDSANEFVSSPEEFTLEVKTTSVTDFFLYSSNCMLPDYQRSYVWNEEKLSQFLIDLYEHFFNESGFNNQAPCYYLGGVLLYQRNGKEIEIIDGQQRITTLLILNHAYKKSESLLAQDKWKLEYKSLLSSKRIKENYQYLLENVNSLIKTNLDAIYAKLVFTQIVTNSQDEAFTFFDSQNSRGVSLSPVDFLKSYHLRELKNQENLQRIFAKQWDSNNKGQFLNELFTIILWRARKWRGKELYFENKDEILVNFQKHTIKEIENEGIRLYPNIFNSLANQLTFDSKNGVMVQPNMLNLQTTSDQYPFSIRQPIQKGVGFFLYTEKYYAIYHLLFKENRFVNFSKVYSDLIMSNSYYLRVFFKTTSVFYYDKFKDNKLIEFALWMDYLLGSYRFNQNSIVAQTVIKILRDNSQNLLDVIEMSYRPEDVFIYIQQITDPQKYTTDLKKDPENGVRNKYKTANLNFFNKKEQIIDFTTKHTWINEYIHKQNIANYVA
jgi:hypothetical protein